MPKKPKPTDPRFLISALDRVLLDGDIETFKGSLKAYKDAGGDPAIHFGPDEMTAAGLIMDEIADRAYTNYTWRSSTDNAQLIELLDVLLEAGACSAENATLHLPEVIHLPIDRRIAIADAFIRAGASLHSPDEGIPSPLETAIQVGDLALVQFLVSQGADAKEINSDGDTLLDLAYDMRSLWNDAGKMPEAADSQKIIDYLQEKGARSSRHGSNEIIREPVMFRAIDYNGTKVPAYPLFPDTFGVEPSKLWADLFPQGAIKIAPSTRKK